MLPFAVSLAVLWGVLWALFLQHVELGRFLAQRRTWLTVVVGVGIDLAILLIILSPWVVLQILAVVAASAVGIVARSIYNEWADEHELLEELDGE